VAEVITQLEFSSPIKTVSEANRPGRESWRTQWERKKDQKASMHYDLCNALRGRQVKLPCTVTLVRVGPKLMDDDNLARAFKAIRDSIANKLGVDDGETDKIRFRYDQIAIGKHKYLVKVNIQSD